MLAAFHQIPLQESSKTKTAVATPFGLFHNNFLPFGLKNDAGTQQRCLDEFFRDLDFTFVYIDEFLIASKDEEEHHRHIKIVYERLAKPNLTLNFDKCEFNKSTIDYLEHRISANGIMPLPKKVAQLKGYIGLANLYSRFLKVATTYLGVHNNAAITMRKKDQTPVDWTEERATFASVQR